MRQPVFNELVECTGCGGTKPVSKWCRACDSQSFVIAECICYELHAKDGEQRRRSDRPESEG